MDRNLVEISKVFGQPISPIMPVPLAISAIAELETVESGDDFYAFVSLAAGTDKIYTSNTSGEVVSIKLNPLAASNIPLIMKQSKLSYVSLKDMMEAKDFSGIARCKVEITENMDSSNVKELLDLIIAVTGQQISGSGKDLYAALQEMCEKVDDYGEEKTLLVGSAVNSKINSYDLDNANGAREYRVSIEEMLKKYNVTLIKIPASVTVDLDDGGSESVLDTNTAILVAGKPTVFATRSLSAAVAAGIGEPAGASRIVIQVGACHFIGVGGASVLGYSVLGCEASVSVITDERAICSADLTNVL